jgi:hypothetical protein
LIVDADTTGLGPTGIDALKALPKRFVRLCSLRLAPRGGEGVELLRDVSTHPGPKVVDRHSGNLGIEVPKHSRLLGEIICLREPRFDCFSAATCRSLADLGVSFASACSVAIIGSKSQLIWFLPRRTLVPTAGEI